MKSLLLATAPILKKNQTPTGLELIYGNSTLGYYGEISQEQLISWPAFKTSLNIGGLGSDINPDATWLKFSSNGKTLYVAKKVIIYGISPQDLINRTLVTGNRQVTIGGKVYKIRILTGSVGTEFDSLLGAVHDSNLNATSFTKFTSEQLGLGPTVNNGKCTICQENMFGWDGFRVGRDNIPSSQTSLSTNDRLSIHGYRPVLELVG